LKSAVHRLSFPAQAHRRSGFFGRSCNCWPLASNVQQVMSGERRNKANAPYDLAKISA